VLRDPGLGEAEQANEVVHGSLAAGEDVQDLPPPGFRHRVERVCGRRCSCHGFILYTDIGICVGSLERGPGWRYFAAAEVAPDWEDRTGQAGYFIVEVLIADRFRGLAFQAVEPEGPGYPPDQIELFSEVHLRSELGLGDGDLIVVALA
jgi:hypothetical protein